MPNRIPVAILGATGLVGQRLVQLLENHPWFEVRALTGSERTVGKPYGQACHWLPPGDVPEYARDMVVVPSEPDLEAALAFSALPAEIARTAEPALAQAGLVVCSNASSHRTWPDVPLVIPEVNPDHMQLIEVQRKNHGWKGFIVTNPNCTSTGLTIALKALQDAFGLRQAYVVSLQALSGASYPGVASLDMLDNVIPYIGGEEAKLESEPRKMLGKLNGDGIEPATLRLSAHANRVAVSDGHLVCASVALERPATPEEASAALSAYRGPEETRDLPSAPRRVIEVRHEPDRPQPRLDRDTGRGMTTVVGRVRPDPLLDLKFVVLSHNTLRGAAGAALLNAELLVKQGWLKRS